MAWCKRQQNVKNAYGKRWAINSMKRKFVYINWKTGQSCARYNDMQPTVIVYTSLEYNHYCYHLSDQREHELLNWIDSWILSTRLIIKADKSIEKQTLWTIRLTIKRVDCDAELYESNGQNQLCTLKCLQLNATSCRSSNMAALQIKCLITKITFSFFASNHQMTHSNIAEDSKWLH